MRAGALREGGGGAGASWPGRKPGQPGSALTGQPRLRGGSRSSVEEPGLTPGPRKERRGARCGAQAASGAGNLAASVGLIASAPGAIPAACPPCPELRCARLPGGQGGRGDVSFALSQAHCERNGQEHNGLRDTAVAAGLCSSVCVKRDRQRARSSFIERCVTTTHCRTGETGTSVPSKGSKIGDYLLSP